MAGPGFTPVFLRNATAYGPSPRMRFDIVINDLCALAWTTRKVAMTSDGSPWRPVVHVEDICEAIYRSLIAPADAVSGKIFNVGQNSENYRVRELAQIVAEEFPGCEVSLGSASGDNRSYRVNFDRIHTRAARIQVSLQCARRGAAAAPAVRAHSDGTGELPVPGLHAPQAAEVSAGDQSDRRRLLLALTCSLNLSGSRAPCW